MLGGGVDLCMYHTCTCVGWYILGTRFERYRPGCLQHAVLYSTVLSRLLFRAWEGLCPKLDLTAWQLVTWYCTVMHCCGCAEALPLLFIQTLSYSVYVYLQLILETIFCSLHHHNWLLHWLGLDTIQQFSNQALQDVSHVKLCC